SRHRIGELPGLVRICLLSSGPCVRITPGAFSERAVSHFRHGIESLPCATGSFHDQERTGKMSNRVTTPRGSRVTASPAQRGPAPVTRMVRSGERSNSPDLQRAIASWLADGRAQGWSARTVEDRRQTMERFCWWLEHEEAAPLALSALTPTRVRSFL